VDVVDVATVKVVVEDDDEVEDDEDDEEVDDEEVEEDEDVVDDVEVEDDEDVVEDEEVEDEVDDVEVEDDDVVDEDVLVLLVVVTGAQLAVIVPSPRTTKLSRSLTSTWSDAMTKSRNGNRSRAAVAAPPSPS
jgi:hypothetical protein